ncbi:TetR family transcriptional regulator [Kribbella antiqua]|uniref:TetR family transcriptional regulator n=1 Tax=Kribbella antiqua TaxID=2512217 RepID=A0A4R2IQK1_9ACTN|nr:TetR family transcriptional regulator [Kribbella antiqua]TCO46932.1 TetR family transcriptional regulator [Kribbella antiqua]
MDRPADDLTARARIRDAAINLFTERGIEAASIRDIAAEAGVSSGLVRHHFGSKQALREACDQYAKERMLQIGEELVFQGGAARTDVATMHPVTLPLQTYLVRSMMDGSDTATALFLEMVDAGEDFTKTLPREPSDVRAYAAVLAAMKMGVFVLRDQVSEAIGEDIASPTGYARLTKAMLDIFTIPVMTPEQLEQLQKYSEEH